MGGAGGGESESESESAVVEAVVVESISGVVGVVGGKGGGAVDNIREAEDRRRPGVGRRGPVEEGRDE